MTPAYETGFIHRFVPALPSSQGVSLLLLHGTGGTEDDLIPLAQTLLPGAALLSPRGKVLEHGMPRFFRRIAEGVFDLEDLKLRTAELAEFISESIRKYDIDGKKLIAVGYSNGANIASSLLLTHPGLLAGAVLFRAMVPFVPQSPLRIPKVPVLLAAGQRDWIVAPAQTAMLTEILETAGAEVQLHWHPGGHELGPDDIEAARNWLARWQPR